MTASYNSAYRHAASRCCAKAFSFARIIPVLGTAVELVVSIRVACLLRLRAAAGNMV